MTKIMKKMGQEFEVSCVKKDLAINFFNLSTFGTKMLIAILALV